MGHIIYDIYIYEVKLYVIRHYTPKTCNTPWKPHDKLVGNGADSDDDFIPATPTAQETTAQETTISHSRPQIYRVQPYKAGASYACRSVLEEVDTGGWCGNC
jgi:hypothetical protein